MGSNIEPLLKPKEKRRPSNIATATLNVLSMFAYQNEGCVKSAAREIA